MDIVIESLMKQFQADHDLDVALRLHEAAHHAVDAVQTLVADIGHQRRDDGVVWPLVRRHDVRMVRRAKRKACATVLECEAAAFGDDASAEAAVVAVDEADATISELSSNP